MEALGHAIKNIDPVCCFCYYGTLCHPDPPTLQTDGRTDRRTTCNLNTALCTSASRGKKEVAYYQSLRHAEFLFVLVKNIAYKFFVVSKGRKITNIPVIFCFLSCCLCSTLFLSTRNLQVIFRMTVDVISR